MPSALDVDRNIRFAIANRRLIRLAYDGRVRIAEPHDYGLINHEPKLLAYQRRDEGSNRPPGWRLLRAGKISALVVLEDTFPGSRADGHIHRFHWDPLICRVE